MKSLGLAALAGLLAMPGAWAQLAISARSGMVNHLDGQVTLNDQPLKTRFGQFPEVTTGSTLASANGRAEVLLNPGVFLRLDDHSSFRMLSSKLTDSRVELSGGAALVEVQELLKNNRVTVVVAGSSVNLLKPGLYRFDADPARVRVYDGKAVVESENAGPLTLTKGRQSMLGPVALAAKFSTSKERDSLYEWSKYRAALVAQANVVSARTAMSQGFRLSSSAWAFSPYWGMFTFLPLRGYGYSGFGMYVFSPLTIWTYYTPRPMPPSMGASSMSQGGLGVTTRGVPSSSPMDGGVVRSSPGPAAAPVSAPAQRARGR
jgi:hypothetical protein